jgi:beta-glucanase (GH16 family)
VQTLDDEFTSDGSINTSNWNYGFSQDAACIAAGCTEGTQCASSRCNDDFNFAHDSLSSSGLLQIPSSDNGTGEDTGFDFGGEGMLNGAGKVFQRYGYWEFSIKLPPDNAAASGMGGGAWFLPQGSRNLIQNGSDCADGNTNGHDEIDLEEQAVGPTGLLGNGSQFSVQTSVYDCGSGDSNGNAEFRVVMSANGTDLTAGFHKYGMNWVNDGTANGTVSFYLDGVQQGTSYQLSSNSVTWASGIYPQVQQVYCYEGLLGSGPCTSDGTTGLQTQYVRVWQAE